MNKTIERLTMKDKPKGDLQEATLRLHLERYEFAAASVKGRRVLDIACGVGYGSDLLLRSGADCVTGVDISEEAISEAQELYGNESRLRFFCSDYKKIGSLNLANSDDNKPHFDMIVSLETIEHLPNPDHFLATVLPYLKSGGLFVGSVPVTPSMDANPFHLQDFSSRSFEKLLIRNGLKPLDKLPQVQKFNPLSVKSEMDSGERVGLRTSLGRYYASNPNKLFLRVYATLRFGFCNIYNTIVAEKL